MTPVNGEIVDRSIMSIKNRLLLFIREAWESFTRIFWKRIRALSS